MGTGRASGATEAWVGERPGDKTSPVRSLRLPCLCFCGRDGVSAFSTNFALSALTPKGDQAFL